MEEADVQDPPKWPCPFAPVGGPDACQGVKHEATPTASTKAPILLSHHPRRDDPVGICWSCRISRREKCQRCEGSVGQAILARNCALFMNVDAFGPAQGNDGEVPVHLVTSGKNRFKFPDREVLGKGGCSDFPMAAGDKSRGVQETFQPCQDTRAAGSDYASMLPRSDYSSILATSQRELESRAKDVHSRRLTSAEPTRIRPHNSTSNSISNSCHVHEQRQFGFSFRTSSHNLTPHPLTGNVESANSATFKRQTNGRRQPCAESSPGQKPLSWISSHSKVLGMFRAMSLTLSWQ